MKIDNTCYENLPHENTDFSMKKNVVNKGKARVSCREGFKNVPAVSEFRIQTGIKNLLLSGGVGLPRKLPAKF